MRDVHDAAPVAPFDEPTQPTPEVRVVVVPPRDEVSPPATKSPAILAPAALAPLPPSTTRPGRHTIERIVEATPPNNPLAERPTSIPTPMIAVEAPAWDATAEPVAVAPPPLFAARRSPDALAPPPRIPGRSLPAPAVPAAVEPVILPAEMPATASTERHVHVTIGRLEVRVGGPPAKATKAAEPANGPTLAEYLRDRRGDAR